MGAPDKPKGHCRQLGSMSWQGVMLLRLQVTLMALVKLSGPEATAALSDMRPARQHMTVTIGTWCSAVLERMHLTSQHRSYHTSTAHSSVYRACFACRPFWAKGEKATRHARGYVRDWKLAGLSRGPGLKSLHSWTHLPNQGE
jgi:hypothetical protein